MKRLVIAVDCDDVLVSTSPYFVDTYNNTYGTSGTLEYAHSPDPSVWGASEEVIVERWFGMTRTDGYKGLSPDPYEVKVLRNLAKIHELHLVTARDCGVGGLLWFGDYPWQTEDLSDMPTVRCRDWREVEAEIERIASN